MQHSHLYPRHRSRSSRALLLSAIVSLCLIVAFLLAVAMTKKKELHHETEQLETSLRRACVTCYAVEGRYPPSLDYIAAHYGVPVDRERYMVLYDAFAENLMPTITVVSREGVDE